MSGKHVAEDEDAALQCRRCKDNVPVISVRSEPLCRECFIRYVHTKSIKRLESFRVRFAAADQQRRLLLPLSYGVSSTVLLHILDHHLKSQKLKTGRTGFALSVVCIEPPDAASPNEETIGQLREKYPGHQYTSLPLHDIFRLIPDDDTLLELVPQLEVDKSLSTLEQLSRLINSLPSATARADVITTLRTRLIVEHAKLSGCESILWGDNCTRLAEKTLAETAKGRGFSLTWQVADGESPFGVQFHYPMRDVLKKELVSYINIVEPDLETLVQGFRSGATQASMSSKNTTIDDLMKQYFESVEENFPSIVSNVVRTTGKLQLPPGAATEPQCSLCSMPVPGGRFGIHGWGGDQQDNEHSTNRYSTLCYGCTRSVPRST